MTSPIAEGQAVKLTKAQRELLERLSRGYQAVRATSRVVKALRIAGLADFDDRAGGGAWWLAITPAGRKALETAEGEQP